MPIYQPMLEVPAEIAARVAAGELGIRGSIVFSKITGKVIMHLKEVARPASSGAAAAAQTAAAVSSTTVTKAPGLFARGILWIKSFATAHPIITGFVAVASVITVAVAGWSAYKKRKVEKEASLRVTELQKSLAEYVNHAMTAQLTLTDISSLLATTKKLKEEYAGETIAIDFESGELAQLLDCIIKHTKRLADINSISIDETELTNGSKLDAMENSLLLQQKILRIA